MTKAAALMVAVLSLSVLLGASEERLCGTSDFRVLVVAERKTFTGSEPITFRLTTSNNTKHEVRIVPHLYPFDYWLEERSENGWRMLGGMVPASRSRRDMPLGPRDETEYRSLKEGETYSTSFVVSPELLRKKRAGRFRIRVHVFVKDTADHNLSDLGCAAFSDWVDFSVR